MPAIVWVALAVIAGGLLLLVLNDGSGSVFGLDTDSFGRLVYLGALGAVLAAGVVGSRMRASQVLRMTAAWLAVILVLVGGYQYRYELQDFASRLTAGLVPGSPMSLTFEDGGSGVRIDRMANGHFEVAGAVNGTNVDFMVDTGATSTVLTLEAAVRAGFPVEGLSFNVPVLTANGQALAARVTADTITVGSITRNRVPVLVAQEGRLGQSLLGMNFIGTLSGFDMRGDRLILRD